MYTKLAVRNVRRQIGNYLIYFMTIAFTVALMFAINNVIFSPELEKHAVQDADFKNFLTGITVFISLIVAFVLSYATSFMLKFRRREFGTYLTLGMKRKQILRIFLGETMVMCAVALGIGILFGALVYQCFMALIARLMETEVVFCAYSARGLLFTVALVTGVFLVSSLSSALYLKKVRIYSLIHGEKRVEKQVKHPLVWFAAAVISMALMIVSCTVFRGEIQALVVNPARTMGRTVTAFFIFCAGIVCFHIGMARGLVCVLLKSRRFCSRGTNTFVMRQLGASLGSNALMMGALAFLLSMAVMGANIVFAQKVGEEELLDQTFPYDIMYIGNIKNDFEAGEPVPQEAADAAIEEYAGIKHKYAYQLYTTENTELFDRTKWSRQGYYFPYDIFMKESDFNALITPFGHEAVHLEGEYLIAAARRDTDMGVDWNQVTIDLGGKACHFGGQYSNLENLITNLYIFFYVVIPDEAAEGMEVMADAAVYNTKQDDFDVSQLEWELTYEVEETLDFENISYPRCDYLFKAAVKRDAKQNGAVLVTGILYVAAVFFLIVMAILALKTLSTLSDDRQRFRILFRLGADRKEESRALLAQTFSFFFLPFAVPVLISIPAAMVGTDILKLNHLSHLSGRIYAVAAAVAAIMTIIYGLYYLATYAVAKRAIIDSGR